MPPLKVEFTVPGVVGKARPRFYKGHAVTPRATRDYELLIAKTFSEALFRKYIPGVWAMDGLVEVRVAAHYPIPKSWSRKKREQALAGGIAPGKPDIDNVVKAVLDGLNGVAFDDDRQVFRLSAEKFFSATEEGHVDVTVEVQA